MRKKDLKKVSSYFFIVIILLFFTLVISATLVKVDERFDVRYKNYFVSDKMLIEITFMSKDTTAISIGQNLELICSVGNVEAEILSIEELDIGLKEGNITIITLDVTDSNLKIDDDEFHEAYLCFPKSKSVFEYVWNNAM